MRRRPRRGARGDTDPVGRRRSRIGVAGLSDSEARMGYAFALPDGHRGGRADSAPRFP